MFKLIRQSVLSTLCLAVLLCAAYPLLVTGVANAFFPKEAAGSLILRDGAIVGSALIGQPFSSAKYFHPRPSAAGYDAGSSSGSNYGPTSKALAERVRASEQELRAERPEGVLPVDMLTASGSGLDPHISPEAALMQARRVAEARGLSLETVEKLVRGHVEGPEWGVWGEPKVNVLRLNLALDELQSPGEERSTFRVGRMVMDGFAELIERKRQGSLKIYLGYAAGVGKTYAMLQEGLRLKQQHVDVVIGYLEPHDRPETMALSEHLEAVPPREWRVGDAVFHEMDAEAILARKPQVVLVDELAHTNADGSKNAKRYQDVLEVLAQGVNVISTINVQHLESVAARVEEATGIAVRERIPDTVLRRADQVVNVDVTKEELRERLRQGKIYAPQQAERALSSFFTYENLSFLRELCLREASGDQVRKIEAQELLKPALAGYAVEAVMVALSSSPTDAESLIRRGVRMANQLGSPCYVVYVRRPQESPTRIDAGIQRQLQYNLQLATRLGAEVVQLEGVDIAETLVNFASERNVRHAIFGKSRLSPLRERLRGSFLLDFLYEAVGVDVHVANVTPKYIK